MSPEGWTGCAQHDELAWRHGLGRGQRTEVGALESARRDRPLDVLCRKDDAALGERFEHRLPRECIEVRSPGDDDPMLRNSRRNEDGCGARSEDREAVVVRSGGRGRQRRHRVRQVQGRDALLSRDGREDP